MRTRSARGLLLVLAALPGTGSVGVAPASEAPAKAATLKIVVENEQGGPLPCRIHLKNGQGQPQRAGELPFFRDHFVCPGEVTLQLAAGTCSFEIERGPEYQRQSGSVDLAESEVKTLKIPLRRIADLAAQGWYSGDLHVHRAVEDMDLLMRAEDLYVAPTITWWNNRNPWTDRQPPRDPVLRFDGNRFCDIMAGEDEREGGALMFFRCKRPLDIAGASREYPSPMKFVEQARQIGGIWIDVEKPFWWDVPVWLASGQIDSIGLANNHMCRSSVYASEAWGRPRETQRLPPPLGNGYWTQEIYYHALNCGLRVPPSAGSASGVLPNPVGYNRVYVHVGEEFDYDKWWDGLRAGRSFVTNGPLLLCRANGRLPGHVFSAAEGQQIDIEVEASLVTLDKVPAIELIKNGRVEQRVAPAAGHKASVSLRTTFNKSGWFLVRAITDNQQTFRFASTAPYYVEIAPSKRRISKRSVQFFLDWAIERAKRVPAKLDDPEKLREVLAYHQQARQFWEELLSKANAE